MTRNTSMNKYTFLLAGSVLLLTGCAGVKSN
ncbi:lipoprotein, partial [Escherichia coli]